MIDKTKNKIKKVLIPIFISILCGAICGKVVYHIYDNKIDDVLTSSVVYLIESENYKDYDSMRANNLSNNYVYYEENGIYKTIIGITKKEENLSKIANLYQGDVIINKYFLNDSELDSKIMLYDSVLSSETDNDEIKQLVTKMNSYYKEKKISLTKVK